MLTHLRWGSFIEFSNGSGESVGIYEINAFRVTEFYIDSYVQKEHTYFPEEQTIISK